MMFGNSSDFIPRTYSVKSFRRRKSIGLKRVLTYFIYFILILILLGIAFLSVNHLI